ncbi:MAG: AAA family ATPase [Tateyamaria sp.]
MAGHGTDLRVLITGCSGGGKSALIDALASLGFATIAEPGRRIIAEVRDTGGDALPWRNMKAFAERAVHMARADFEAAKATTGPVFFDRGLVDAAVASHHVIGTPLADILGPDRHYANPVFVAPPWPEIFRQDADRQHGFDAAVAEYDRLSDVLPRLGYTVVEVPKVPVSDRVTFVLTTLGLTAPR